VFLTYFIMLNSNVLFELLYHPQLCVTEFLKCDFSEFFFFSRYQYVSNMADALFKHSVGMKT